MDRKRGIRERGNSIQIDFYYQGMRCRESLKLEPTKPNIAFAQRFKAAIKHEIAIGTFDYSKHFPNSTRAHIAAKGINKTINQALDDFLQATRRTLEASTWKGYKSAVECHLRPNFGHIRLSELTSSDIKSWIGSLSISPKRINNVLIPLRTIYADAFSDGLIDRNPVDRISNLAVRFDEPQPFTPDEINRILQELSQQGKNLIQFAVWTGLRTSELIALEWAISTGKKALYEYAVLASIRLLNSQKHTLGKEM